MQKLKKIKLNLLQMIKVFSQLRIRDPMKINIHQPIYRWKFLKSIWKLLKKNLNFLNPKDFDINFHKVKIKKILVTIDDGFSSFYEHAWPYLKKNKIPFILFISTEVLGKWLYELGTTKEIDKEKFAFIEIIRIRMNTYWSSALIILKDILKSIEIFENNLGYNPIFFSYPFGEFSLEQTFNKKIF